MNRRDKKNARQLEFEPKVPATPPVVQLEQPVDAPRLHTEEMSAMKGCYAPATFAQIPKFNPTDDGFILNLPDFLADASLVLFADGSFGLRKDGIIYECDTSYLGNSMVVELGEAVVKTGSANFLITGYQIPKSFNA